MPPLGRDLPGLYYDPERGRYFPLSSRPAGPPTQPPDIPSVQVQHQRKRARYQSSAPGSLHHDLKSCSSKPWERRNLFRAQTAAHYTRTSFSTTETISGANITSYSVSSLDDTHQIAGDAAGFIWSLSERLESSGLDGPLRMGFKWQAQYGLMSRISSTSIVGDRFFAASFGPHPTILYGALPLNSEAKLNVITPRHQWDTWSGVFDSSSFVLGLTRHIWFVPDLENLRSSRMFNQETDVLSLTRSPMVLTNGIVSGARNGSVRLYDMRVVHASPGTETASIGQEILQARSSVTNIQAIREWEFLVSAVNGDIDIYDLRSLRATQTTSRRNPPKGEWISNGSRGRIPILSLEGHRSTFSIDLPLALDPSQDFLFAAGEDKKIRAWNTRNGERLLAPSRPSPTRGFGPNHGIDAVVEGWGTRPTLFERTFNYGVSGLQITEGRGKRRGPSLWLADGATFERFDLGCQL